MAGTAAARGAGLGMVCVLLAGCTDQVTGPPLARCQGMIQPLALAVRAYVAIDPQPTEGCVIFPANTSGDSAEYLLVPQATTETPDLSGTFALTGGAPAAAAATTAALYQEPAMGPADQFHIELRELERTRSYPGLAALAAAERQGAALAAGLDTVGNRRTFKVLSNLSPTRVTYADVGAIARSVGQHIAIYVDSTAPASGLTTADLDAMRDVFDTQLYPADTAAFGRESDIDGNGRVLVVMTGVVNQLVTAAECNATGYVGGFFYGGDIDPSSAYLLNRGEVFYTMVADPDSTLSCAHSIPQVQRVIPVVLVHEFQHMISYNQHVLIRNQNPEVLWLNEALSHYAEERGGRSFLPVDSVSFCNFVRGDLYNAALYLADPGNHALVDTSGIGGLAERGAGWMFVRYLVDRFAAGTTLAAADAFTRSLDATSLTGTANVAQATGVPFSNLAEQWALANWVSDLPGFSAPAELSYQHWAFRTAYPHLSATCSASLPSSYPLVALSAAGPSVALSGAMESGSAGGYQLALQGPGDPSFTLLFSDATGAQLRQTVVPRLNILRIR
jgi:hypothetical protein